MCRKKQIIGWRLAKRFLCLVMAILLFAGAPSYAAVMQPYDLTSFTEADPGGNVAVSASAITYTNIETRDRAAFIYKPQSLPGDFVFEFDAMVTAGDTNSGPILLWGATNTANQPADLWSDGFYLAFLKTSGGMALRFYDCWQDWEEATGFALNTRYYFRVTRVGPVLTAQAFTDAGRTVIKGTVARNAADDEGTILYTNLYAFGVRDSNLTTRKATGDVRNLAIQTAGQPAPAAPVLNSATPGDGKVTLAWGSVTGATGFKIKYGTASGSYTTTLDVGNVTTKEVTGLTNSQIYYFVVTAYNTNGESANSNERSATPVLPPLPDQIAVVTDVQYNAAGQITRLEYGNGTVTEYTYNTLNLRLTNLKTTLAGGTVAQDLSYTYDSAGNILSIADAVNTADQTFEYDHLNRLTKATGQAYGAKNYTYDEIGNIVSKEGISYIYGENGAGPHAVTHLSDGTAFTYDANGNMATKVKGSVTTTYAYDAENRLLNIKKNGASVSDYEYDGDGGRTKKKVYGTLVATTEFIGSLFEKEDSHVSRHVYLGDKRIATVKDGAIVYHFDDHLGGANVIADSSGQVKELAEYLPFGSFARHDRQGSTDLTQNFFTGQRLDPEDGLYYYGARYYDPAIGRFIQADTVVPSLSNPQEFNRYSYALNNPLNRIDPSGNFSFKSFFNQLAGGVIGGIVGVLTGNPFLGFSAYNAFIAVSQGGNIGAALAGAAVGYFGGGLVGNAFGSFWGTMSAGIFGGTAGAAIGGGNIGLAALSGFGGSMVGYGVGALTGFAGLGTIIGSGASSEISGGDFVDGALGGLAYNVGFTLGSTVASWNDTPNESADIPEDSQVFFAGDRIGKEGGGWFGKLYSAGMAVLDPGPFNHTGIGAGNGKVIDSHPARGLADGPNVRSVTDFTAFQNDRITTIQHKTGLTKAADNLMVDLRSQGKGFGGMPLTGTEGVFCSQFTAQARKAAGETGVYGTGPNSQYWFSR